MARVTEYADEERAHFSGMSVLALSPIADYSVSNQFAKSLANMIAYSWLHGLRVYVWGHTERTVVDWARNILGRYVRDHVCEYTDKPYTHCLWLDSDQTFNPDLLCQLARHDKDMVSALYFARGEKPMPIAYVKPDKPRSVVDLEDKDTYKHSQILEVPPALMEVDAVGFGGLLMKQEIFTTVPEPWFTIDYKAGEDVAFCVKAKTYGYRIYLDGQYHMGHIDAPKVVSTEDYNAYRAAHPDEFENLLRCEIEG